MDYLNPFRNIIQYISACIVDSVNFLLQDSEMDILRKEIKALRESKDTDIKALRKEYEEQLKQMISPSINLTDNDLIPDDPQHRALYDRAHMHFD
jgi:hypothetical protein